MMKESRRDQEDREVIEACYTRLQEFGLGEDKIFKKLNKLFTRQKVAIVLKGPKGLLPARFLASMHQSTVDFSGNLYYFCKHKTCTSVPTRANGSHWISG